MKKWTLKQEDLTKPVSVSDNPGFEKLGYQELAVEQGFDGAWYLEGYAPSVPAKTPEQLVFELECAYALPRPVRTTLLALRASGSVLDAELMGRVEEIEGLAAPLRIGMTQ